LHAPIQHRAAAFGGWACAPLSAGESKVLDRDKGLGVVSTGGGNRNWYSAGIFYRMLRDGYNVKHISATSGGVGAAYNFLGIKNLDKYEAQCLHKISTHGNVHRYAAFVKDWFNNGTYFWRLDPAKVEAVYRTPERYRQFLAVIKENLAQTRLSISLSMVNKEPPFLERAVIDLEAALAQGKDPMELMLAASTIIPETRAIRDGDSYLLDGGYTNNAPLSPLFADDNVEQILVLDYSNHNYFHDFENLYGRGPLTYMQNLMDMRLLEKKVAFDMGSGSDIGPAVLINSLLQAIGKKSITLGGRRLVHKPIYVLRPSGLDMDIAGLGTEARGLHYYQLGKQADLQVLQPEGAAAWEVMAQPRSAPQRQEELV
jgi:predicted patatin/cPLA2 family phospholipase